MANNLNGLFTAVLSSADTNLGLMPEFANNFLDNCYTGYEPGQTATPGIGQQITINMPIVDENNVTDIGNGEIVIKDTNQTPVTVPADHKFSTPRIIKNFDQARSPLVMQRQYLKPMVEECMRKANRALAVAVVAAATANAKITGPASANPAFSRVNLSKAWTNLTNQGCPAANLVCLTNPTPFGNMVGDDNNKFISQFIVGDKAAETAQQTARLMPQFNAKIDYDQHVGTQAGAAAGTYGGVFYHKMAVAFAPFVEKGMDGSHIKRTVIFPTKGGNIPFGVQMWESGEKQGIIMHVFLCCGFIVVKPEWVQYLETLPATS